MNLRPATLLALAVALGAFSTLTQAAPPPGYCEVKVCNKLERFTLDPWKMAKDSFGEICQPALMGKEDAVVGKTLNSSSRWYQGSFNPTKSSVTRVKSVIVCTPEVVAAPVVGAKPATLPVSPAATPAKR